MSDNIIEDAVKKATKELGEAPENKPEKSEAVLIAEAQLKAQLMLKTSLEHVSGVMALVAQVMNAGNNGKALKEGGLKDSIRQINKSYMDRLEEIARG